MPSNQAVWGIEIGQCALKAIRLRHDSATNKVEALAFDYIEHSKILSQPDADPDALSREAIQTFLSRNTVKGDRVVIGVPGQSGLARFIKLPPVEPSRIPEIVKYEARQQIPFALEEVVWDFQTIGNAEEAGGFALETEIGLFAMKRDLIYRFMNPFRETGVEVDVVQMRPLAVYNFAAYDQITTESSEEEDSGDGKEKSEYQREELVESKKPAERTAGGFVVLLDMGADNSDLVITDGTRIWQRNLPIGGNHFTRALTKELKLTFAKAEHLKRNATKAQDPRAIFQAMRPVFNDLVSEIQRSIGYFSSVHRQSKITRIIGMGNAFKLPGLQKFLAQNLQYEVEKVESFKCLKGDQVLSAPAFQENILSFSVVYGLALQGLDVSGVRTSLLPPEISQARMIRRKKPWALSAAAILMAGFTALFFGNWAQLNAVSSSDFDPPKQKADAAQKLKTEKKNAYDKVKTEWSTIKTNGEALTENVEKRLEWIEVLSAINKALPDNPANIDRKDLKKLGEVQITTIAAAWHEDVKGWFDRNVANPDDWPSTTVHDLDKSKPPSGGGWVFELEGYHFNERERHFTMYALLDTDNGFQSASVREFGIQGAMVTYNTIDSNWIPGSAQKTASKTRRTRSSSGSGGFGGGGDSGMVGSRGGGSGGLGAALGGGMASAVDDGKQDRSDEMDERSGGSQGVLGSGSAPPGFGGQAGDPVTGGAAPITKLPRTDFILEFVWIPTEKGKRTPAASWLTQMQAATQEAVQKTGQRTRKVSDTLLKRQEQRPPASGAGGLTQPGSTGQPQTNSQPTAPGTPGLAQPPNPAQPTGAPGGAAAGEAVPR
jgi:type IV pilus assembly protein PilM